MRPRKKVLLHCQNEQVASVYRFMIDNCRSREIMSVGFRAYLVSSTVAGDAMANLYQFDSVLVIRCGEGKGSVEAANHYYRLGMKVVFLNHHPSRVDEGDVRANFFFGYAAKTEELMERLRIICQRKRGPKKLEAVFA
jgi:hypothetical protein